MSKQQLYINDVAVDMPAEEIKIKVESNLFADASKIKTAHSYNIALPRTMTNDSIFSLAYVAGASTAGKTTHKYLSASLHLDGVPLFTDGQAVLTGVDKKGYNITLLWGIIGVFDEIKDEGLKLCDLPLSSHWSEAYETWVQLVRSNATYISGMNADIYDGLDAESKAEVALLPWTLPVVSANNILTTISNVYGVTLNFSTTAAERVAELYHPLTSLNLKANDEVLYLGIKAGYTLVNGNYHLTFAPFTTSTDFPDDIVFSSMMLADWYANNDNIGNNAIWARNDANGSIFAKCNLNIKKIRVHGTTPVSPANITVIINDDGESEDTKTFSGAFDYTWTDVSIKRDENVMRIGSNTTWQGSAPATDVRVEMEIEGMDGMVVSHQMGLNLNTWYGLIRNYPYMKVIDYISELLAHIGAFIVGTTTDTGEVNVVTFDEVFANAPKTYDTQGVEKITMSLSDVAQRNVYKHADNDDNVPYAGEGTIYTADKTIKAERDAFKSSFKVPYNAMVRLFKVDDDRASWTGGGDYISGMFNGVVRNTGQGFDTILDSYYSSNKAMMRTPKTIEAVVRLDYFQLRDFDFTRPVYIKQIGRTYIVTELENESNDTYKIKMIQI